MSEVGEHLTKILELRANLPERLHRNNLALPEIIASLPNSQIQLEEQLKSASTRLEELTNQENRNFQNLINEAKEKANLFLPAIEKFLISDLRETHEEETRLSLKAITNVKNRKAELQELIIPAIELKLEKLEIQNLINSINTLEANKLEQAKVYLHILNRHGSNLKILLEEKDLAQLLAQINQSLPLLKEKQLISLNEEKLYSCIIALNRTNSNERNHQLLEELYIAFSETKANKSLTRLVLQLDQKLADYLVDAQRSIEIIQQLEKIKEAKELGVTSQTFIDYGRKLAEELTIIFENQDELHTTLLQKRLNLLAISHNNIDSKELLTFIDKFKLLTESPSSNNLINYIRDKSLFRADVIENFLYYDFLPVASSIAAGIILSSATGGLAACLIAGSRYRLYASLTISTAKYLGQGYGGTFGYEVAKELIFQQAQTDQAVKDGKAIFSDRALLFKYITQSENITLTDVILNYNLNSLYSAAASFITVRVGSKFGDILLNKRVNFNLWARDNLPRFLSSKVQPFAPIAEAFNHFCSKSFSNSPHLAKQISEIIKTCSKPYAILKDTQVYKLLSEFNEELWEEFLEETIAISGNVLKDKMNITALNVPLLSPEAAILIGITQMLRGKSPRYRYLVENHYKQSKIQINSLDDGYDLWEESKNTFNLEAISQFCKRMLHLHHTSYTNSSKPRPARIFNFAPFNEVSHLVNSFATETETPAFKQIIESLTYFGIANEQTKEAILAKCESANYIFSIQELIVLTQHLMIIGDSDTLHDFLIKIEKNNSFSNLTDSAKLTFYRAHILSKKELPSYLYGHFDDHERDLDRSSVFYSGFEEEVYNTIIRLGGNPSTQDHIYGYAVDLYIEIDGRKIVVECDGDRFHYIGGNPQNGSLGKDRIKDNVLRSGGYEIIRVSYDRWKRSSDPINKILIPALTNGYMTTEDELKRDLSYNTALHLLNENLSGDYQTSQSQQLLSDSQTIIAGIEELDFNVRNELIREELFLLSELNILLQLILFDRINPQLKLRAFQFIHRVFTDGCYYAGHVTTDERFLAALSPIFDIIDISLVPLDTLNNDQRFILCVIASLQGGEQGILFIKDEMLKLLHDQELEEKFKKQQLELIYEALSLAKTTSEQEERKKSETLKKLAKKLPYYSLHLADKYRSKNPRSILAYNSLIAYMESHEFNFSQYFQHEILSDILASDESTPLNKKQDKPIKQDNFYEDRFRQFLSNQNYLSYEEIVTVDEANAKLTNKIPVVELIGNSQDYQLRIQHRHRQNGVDGALIARIESNKGREICEVKVFENLSGSAERNLLEQFIFSFSRDVLAKDRFIPIHIPLKLIKSENKRNKILSILQASNPGIEFLVSEESSENGEKIVKYIPYSTEKKPITRLPSEISSKNAKSFFDFKVFILKLTSKIDEILELSDSNPTKTINLTNLTLHFYHNDRALTAKQLENLGFLRLYLRLFNHTISAAELISHSKIRQESLYDLLAFYVLNSDDNALDLQAIQEFFKLVIDRVNLTIPHAIDPHNNRSLWHWAIATSQKGGVEALNYLDYELRRVGNIEQNEQNAYLYQAILLESIFLTTTNSSEAVTKKREILNRALKYQSQQVRELAELFLSKELSTETVDISSYRIFWNYFLRGSKETNNSLLI